MHKVCCNKGITYTNELQLINSTVTVLDIVAKIPLHKKMALQ